MTDYDDPPHQAWWELRESAYLLRPQVGSEIGRLMQREDLQLEADRMTEIRLLADVLAGHPGARDTLRAELEWQATRTGPAWPSALSDPQEWNAFFLHFFGRRMPLNAVYEAARHAAAAQLRGGAQDPGEPGLLLPYCQAELKAERLGRSLWQQVDRTGTSNAPPTRFWSQPPSGPLTGPYRPSEAVDLLHRAPPAGPVPCLLYENRAARLQHLPQHSQFRVDAWIYAGTLTWQPVRIAGGLTLGQAAEEAAQASALREVRFAHVRSGAALTAFRFMAGTAVTHDPAAPAEPGWPEPCTPAQLLARITARHAPQADEPPASPAPAQPQGRRRALGAPRRDLRR